MRSGFNIGRIFNIRINIDWSWLFIFFLVTWNLITVFGRLHPSWEFGLQLGVALGASLLFFVSVLAHELAHSLMAKAQGVKVNSITLHLFGGVSNIQKNPPTPTAEFLITIVGPITSIILGTVFVLISGVRTASLGQSMQNPSDLIAQLDPLSTLLLWLGPINIILGIFNLIPGFPLDGGRILRSALWAITENLKKATKWASWVGQAIAWFIIVTGIAMAFGVRVPFFGQGLINGLWLAFIGWFLNSASSQSYQQILVQDLLEGISVKELMREYPPTVPPESSVDNLIHNYVMQSDDHAFPVVDSQGFEGLVTLEDIRRVARDAWSKTTVREIMTPREKVINVQENEEASEAMQRLARKNVRQLPVLREEELVGLLRRQDIVKWLHLQADENITKTK